MIKVGNTEFCTNESRQRSLPNGLNQEQQLALEYTEGALLIIAAPGSGKTKTLVERVVHLVCNGIEPEKIMVATFTEKAAKELVTRISNRLLELDVKANLNEMYIGTLHSIFLRILEEHREYTRLKRNYRLFDPFDQAFFVFRNISKFYSVRHLTSLIGEHRMGRWAMAQSIVKHINVVSEEVLDVDELKRSNDFSIQALAECYEIYQGILEEENAIDFSSIQSECLNLLQKHSNVLDELQDKLQYFMVDEYQDTNTVQEKILLIMSSKNHNICVVGDDDQGLYRFRGATIRNILEFENNFAAGECKKIYLQTNYRSHPDIIKFYSKWMRAQRWEHEGRTFRFDKSIQPCDRSFPETAAIVKVTSRGKQNDYFREVLSFIKTLQKEGVVKDLNQIAYLARSVKGDKVVALANYLEENGIRVFSPRSELFFEREEVRMILGCIFTLFPQLDDNIGEWNNTMQNYCKQLQDDFFAKVEEDPERNKQLIRWVISRQKNHLNLQSNSNYGFTGLLYQMLQFPIFGKYLDTDLSANKNDLRPAYNIGILTGLLTKFEYLYNVTVFTSKNVDKILSDFINSYLLFIIEGGLGEYENFDENIPSGCVSFMTIHQSKGLEFPITMVNSLNAVPRKSYGDIDELLQTSYFQKPMYEPIEETKYYDFSRLYYTAFSRAQNLLVLTGHEHDGAGRLPSAYFKEIWEETPSWRNAMAFDMKKLELAEVKPVNIKHEYSFTSHILLYETCPLQYKFYKEFEFSEVRTGGSLGGSLLHETIEDIHKAVLRGEINSLTDENITNWFNSNYQLLVRQLRSFLREEQQNAILKQVLRYRDRNEDRWDTIKEAEVDVSLVKDDYILKGKIDLVQGENDTVELVDFKSGDKPDVNTRDDNKRRVLNQYRRQLEIYAYIIEQRYGVKVSKMHLYYPKEEDGNPRITFPYKEQNIAQTIESFDEVVRKIESKDFSMKSICKTEKHCSECDMRFYCNNRI